MKEEEINRENIVKDRILDGWFGNLSFVFGFGWFGVLAKL